MPTSLSIFSTCQLLVFFGAGSIKSMWTTIEPRADFDKIRFILCVDIAMLNHERHPPGLDQWSKVQSLRPLHAQYVEQRLDVAQSRRDTGLDAGNQFPLTRSWVKAQLFLAFLDDTVNGALSRGSNANSSDELDIGQGLLLLGHFVDCNGFRQEQQMVATSSHALPAGLSLEQPGRCELQQHLRMWLSIGIISNSFASGFDHGARFDVADDNKMAAPYCAARYKYEEKLKLPSNGETHFVGLNCCDVQNHTPLDTSKKLRLSILTESITASQISRAFFGTLLSDVAS
ncbi:hypothetical protein F5Y12DRAFT_715007 [Xylaria sp. FL1777]|nr:hypothetical protein F5Y12DRAFT_715007 [Xylaria sp. FL1777]